MLLCDFQSSMYTVASTSLGVLNAAILPQGVIHRRETAQTLFRIFLGLPRRRDSSSVAFVATALRGTNDLEQGAEITVDPMGKDRTAFGLTSPDGQGLCLASRMERNSQGFVLRAVMMKGQWRLFVKVAIHERRGESSREEYRVGVSAKQRWERGGSLPSRNKLTLAHVSCPPVPELLRYQIIALASDWT